MDKNNLFSKPILNFGKLIDCENKILNPKQITNLKELTENKFGFISDYHPYKINGILNPEFDNYSKLILDLKNNDIAAINFFATLLRPIIPRDYVITTVPSSDKDKIDTGINNLSKILISEEICKNGIDFLIRIKTIEKLAHGGNRSYDTHSKSLAVSKPEEILNQNIFLLDDVTTTNISINVAKDLLEKAGAKNVICLALAQTKR